MHTLALQLALRHWPTLLAAVASAYVAYAAGHRIGAMRAWSEAWDAGRVALQAETEQALREKNDEARVHERRMRSCLVDPACRVRFNDGWRIDPVH